MNNKKKRNDYIHNNKGEERRNGGEGNIRIS